MKTIQQKWENDSPIQINISINVENGKINGAREFADLLCSKRLHVKGYRIRFTQKRNNKNTVLVEANYRPIGTIDIMKGFVSVSSVDGSKVVMYGSPDREFPDNEQVLTVMFHDAFGIVHEIARVENGMLNTSDIELAQRIVNIYSDFVERMIVPIEPCDQVDEIRKAIVRIGNNGVIDVFDDSIEICDGEDPDGNPEGEWHHVTEIWWSGLKMDNGDLYEYSDLSESELEKVLDYINGI